MKEELYSYVNTIISKKGFDDFTSKKILDYIEAHDLLYGHIIDTKDVADRISNNLNKNIQFDLDRGGSAKGGYGPVSKGIYIFTKDFADDEYFHELDHCATSDLSTMPDFDAPDAWYNEAMAKRDKEGYKFYIGIEVTGQKPSGPDFKVAQNENEGITVLKQRDYAKLKGIPFTENGYDINYNIAEQIGYIIGRENLLQKHFYNDVDGISEELLRYGIDYDEMLKLSSKIQNTNELSLDFYNRFSNPNSKEEEKLKITYQNIMAQGFVSKRCQELGIVDLNNYFSNLSRKQRKIELDKLNEFEQFKICDNSIMEYIRSELQPKSILQTIRKFFTNSKTKRLPEKTSQITEEPLLNEHSTNDILMPWDLSNWGIDIEEFQKESYRITQDNLEKSLEMPGNSIENSTQIDSKLPVDMNEHIH